MRERALSLPPGTAELCGSSKSVRLGRCLGPRIPLAHEAAPVWRTAGVKLRGPEGAQRARATSAAGWPRRIAPPGLPLIRTCGFPASGSSGHGFAISDAIRPSFVEMLDELSVQSIVPPNGSVTRSPLPSAGSLEQLSQRSLVSGGGHDPARSRMKFQPRSTRHPPHPSFATQSTAELERVRSC